MGEAAILHGDIQRAKRDAEGHGYRVEELRDGWLVMAPVPTLQRWRRVATFYSRAALVEFLVAVISVEDHLPYRRAR